MPQTAAAKWSTLTAELAATEAFVYLMRRHQVRTHDLTVERWGHAGRYRVARPFWPVTVESEHTPSGYGVNTRAEVLRYTQHDPAVNEKNRLPREYGPGCREILARATGPKRAFECAALSPEEAEHVAAEFLLDAAVSLADGCGPLLVGVVEAAPPRDKGPGMLECSEPWPVSSARSSTESCPAGSSTRPTTSSRS